MEFISVHQAFMWLELVIGLSTIARVVITPYEPLSSPSSWRSLTESSSSSSSSVGRNYKIVATSGKSAGQENLYLRLVEERTDSIETAQFDRGLIAGRVGGQRDLCRRVSDYSRPDGRQEKTSANPHIRVTPGNRGTESSWHVTSTFTHAIRSVQPHAGTF